MDSTQTFFKLVIPEAINHVYAGSARACCCGCAGTHSYREGYGPDYGKVSERAVKLNINKLIRAALERMEELEVHVQYGNGYVAVETGDRVVIGYIG